MGLSESKIQCLVLPGQWGKTIEAQVLVRQSDFHTYLFGPKGGNFNIFIQANNRSLVDQTGIRMERELYESNKRVLNWHSGGNENYSVENLATRIRADMYDMVICCANRTRLGYVAELIKLLSTASAAGRWNKLINIWIDEADSSIDLWSSSPFDELLHNPIIKSVTLISATIDAIVQKFGRVKIHPFTPEKMNKETYFAVQDYEIQLFDYDGFAPEYVKAVYSSKKDLYSAPGTRVFAPGDVPKRSHDEIADFFLSEGFAVVILNGDRKEILIPGAKKIDLLKHVDFDDDSPKEIGQVIAGLYKNNNLNRFPFVVTGHICLGRGITFQNADFLFDHQILPMFPDRPEAYQAACRGAGNIRKLPNFLAREATGFVPTITCSTRMKKLIVQGENIAKNLAADAHEKELKTIGKADLMIASRDVQKGSATLVKLEQPPLVIPRPKSFMELVGQKFSRDLQKKYILSEVKRLFPELHETIQEYECKHINNYRPSDKTNYRPNVEPHLRAAKEKDRTDAWVENENLEKNIWWVALDHGNNNLIVLVHHGKKSESADPTPFDPFG